MTTYTVHLPKGLASAEADPLRLVFVKEGFCWPALFLPAIWLLFRTMWLVLILYVAVVGLLFLAGRALGEPGAPVLALLFAFLFALEANQLRRWTLARRGYRLIAVADGRGRTDAERRFFDRLADPVPTTLAGAPLPATPRPNPVYPAGLGQPPVVGLFPRPGGAG